MKTFVIAQYGTKHHYFKIKLIRAQLFRPSLMKRVHVQFLSIKRLIKIQFISFAKREGKRIPQQTKYVSRSCQDSFHKSEVNHNERPFFFAEIKKKSQQTLYFNVTFK